MRARRLVTYLLTLAGLVWAHPMGNFSVSRYSRLTVGTETIHLDYVVDLAEIPAFQELQAMGASIERLPADAELQRFAERKAVELTRGLELEISGRRARFRIAASRAQFLAGAGGLPTLKIHVKAETQVAGPGEVRYQDKNYEGRTGWREIVVAGKRIEGAEKFSADLSRGLEVYPEDRYNAPPQVAEAVFRVLGSNQHTPAPILAAKQARAAEQRVEPAPPSPKKRLGNLTRGDFLSKVVSAGELRWQMVALALGAAFCLGAFHALSPGHGKTIVAAYLVGSRGTVKHAIILGGVVTFTHTVGVFVLGGAVVLAGPRMVPERMYPWLGVACGLSIVGIGATMLRKRWKALQHHHPHHHQHHHGHDHDHHHHGHSHEIPEKVTLANLVALGVSGGIVPCPSALVVLLAAISLNRAALGVLLIVAFSLGLAMVLSAIGIAMVRARRLLDRAPLHGALVKQLPLLSSAVVSMLGLGIALQALMRIW